jgi:hypothetical protein
MVFPTLADIVAPKPTGLYRSGDNRVRGFGGISIGGGVLADLARVRVNYVLEVREGGRILRSVALPMAPTDIQIKRTHPVDVRYTLGDRPIRDHTPNRMVTIDLSGRGGQKRRSGHNRKGEIVHETGTRLVQEFDAFLDAYQSTAAARNSDYIRRPDQLRTVRGRVQLVFRAFDEGLHVAVEIAPGGWSRTRNAQRSRLTEEWRLSLHAYAPVKPDVPGNFLGPIAAASLWVAEGIRAVNSVVSVTDNILRNARSDLEVLREPFRALKETGTLTRSVVDAGGDLVDFPRVLMADIALAAGEFRQAFSELKATQETTRRGFASGRRALQRAFSSAEETEIAAITALGMLGGGPRAQEAAQRRRDQGERRNTIPVQSEQETRGRVGDLAYELRTGDTLRSLATVAYGDASRWIDIARANGFTGTRTRGDGSPLGPGAALVIPGAGDGPLMPSPQLRPEDMFGVDLRLDFPGGDLILDEEGTDILTIKGPPLYEQAVRNRVLARQGGSAHFPDYGLHAIPGDPFNASTLGYLTSTTVEQLLRDPRTREVPTVVAVDEGDTAALAFQTVPVIGDVSTVIAPVPR